MRSVTSALFLKFICALGIVTCLALGLDAPGLTAQVPTGSIVGSVVDQQGLPVEGVTVTLTNQGTNYVYNAVTGSNGGYQFRSIDYGMYEVTAKKEGFKSGVIQNIKLDAATAYSVPPMRLEVGTKTETVTVEAGAEVVNTTNAEQTGTVEKEQIDELPILDRNPLALLSLQPGVANSGPNGSMVTTINGQRSTFSTLTLDGINIQDNFIRENDLDFSPNLPFLSQTQEFTVTQQNGDVEKSGSSSVSLVTPKGTNNWHGSAFWFYRSNSWRANDWFNAASGVPVPFLLQNQGGGNIGGPLIRNKLFIYGYYELLRLRAATPINTTILSPAIQAALAAPTPTLPFTYQPVDSLTGAAVGSPVTTDLLQFPSSSASGWAADPTMLSLIKQVPGTPNNNRVGDGVNLLGYQFNKRDNTSRDNTGVRVDYNLNDRNTFSATYNWNRIFTDRPDQDLSFDTVPLIYNDDHINFLSTSWRWNPKATVTNEVRFGFNLAPAFFLTGQNFSSGTLIDSANTPGFLPFTNPNPNFLPQGRNAHTWVWQDNATWIHGNHLFKFGGQFERVTIYDSNSAGIYPTLQLGFSANNSFSPSPTTFPGPPGTEASTADFNNGTALLASVVGILSNVSQTFNVTSQTSGYINQAAQVRNYSQNNFALYFADIWKATRKLTVNFGVRWDDFSPVNEKKGLVLLPVIPLGQTAAQTLLSDATIDFAGGPTKRSLYYPFLGGFSPNVGVAWDPFGDGKTAVRAGFSMNYVNDSFFAAADNASVGNAGLSTTSTADPIGLNGPTVSHPVGVTTPSFQIPTTFSQNAALLGIANNIGYAIDPNLRPPYVLQWNLSVQRDLGGGTTLTVSYVGNHGVGLFRAVDVNQVFLNQNGFLADFNRARQNGFLAASVPANDPRCTGPGTATQCGQFNPLYNPNLPGSQPLTIFPGICGPGALGFIGPVDYSGLGFLNNDIFAGTYGDLANIYHYAACNPSDSAGNVIPNFFVANDLILGGDLLKNSSFSSYNAGVLELQHRMGKGLYFQVSYVFSKVMTDYGTGTTTGNDQSRFLPYLNNADPQYEKARAPFDITQQFKANFTYQLPIGHGHNLSSDNRLISMLLDGWQTGSIFTWQTGAPFSILSAEATLNRGGTRSSRNTAFATLTHGQLSNDLGVFKQSAGTVYLINPKLVSPDGTGAPADPQLSCIPAVTGGFCNPQPGEVGNLQLYAFNGPAYFNWDLSATKLFHITERVSLSFRTDAFNVLNHPTFAPPVDSNGNSSMNINQQQFGQSVSTISTPRILQMSLTVKF
jgi:Carboxypeptidase regulatory-like domain/TonB dependent receptor